jgi:hypothetical protein
VIFIQSNCEIYVIQAASGETPGLLRIGRSQARGYGFDQGSDAITVPGGEAVTAAKLHSRMKQIIFT